MQKVSFENRLCWGGKRISEHKVMEVVTNEKIDGCKYLRHKCFTHLKSCVGQMLKINVKWQLYCKANIETKDYVLIYE